MAPGEPSPTRATSARDTASARLVVMQSFPRPRPTTNPYLVQLADALRELPGIEVRNFSWRDALLSRYDVFHVHWPEILVGGRTPLRAAARRALVRLLLLRWRLARTAVVRTVHNLERPSGLSRAEQRLLDRIDAATTYRIRLSGTTPVPDGPSAVIPHGHYRDWFAGHRVSSPVPGRIAYVGLIRRYKGVEQLVESFAATAPGHPELSLTIGGRPSSREIAETLTRAAEVDPRIATRLRFLDDEELVTAITSSELVVLPYRTMHNSGTTLAALSLGRPVLVPESDLTRALAAEVGPGWVHLFRGDLSSETLIEALEASRTARADPRLESREWPAGAEAHAAAYRAALSVVRA